MKKIVLMLAVVLAANIIYSQVNSIPSASGSGSSYYQTVQDEGSSQTQRATLNFAGAGVSCADDTTKTTCTISGSGSAASDLTDCKLTYSSGTVITLGACTAGIGNHPLASVAQCATSAAPANSGTMKAYLSSDGVFSVGFTGTDTTTCAGWTVVPSLPASPPYPVGSLPFGSITWTAGAWNNDAIDDRRFQRRDVVLAGDGLESATTNGVTTHIVEDAVTRDTEVQSGALRACTGGSGSDAYTCSMTPTLTGYTNGMRVVFIPDASNTGAAQLNINSLGNFEIKKCDATTAPSNNDLVSGIPMVLTYHTATSPDVWLLPCNPATVSGGGGSILAPVAWASDPTCSTTAFLQKYTDAIYESVCDGASTKTYFHGSRKVTLPVAAANWTNAGNGGSGMSSPADDNGSVVMEVTTSSSTQNSFMLDDVPGGAFTITLELESVYYATSSAAVYCGAALTAGTATTSDYFGITQGFVSSAGQSRFATFYATDFDRASPTAVFFYSEWRPKFFRLAYSSPTMTLSVSQDGRKFMTLGTSTAFTPTHYGTFCQAETTNGKMAVKIVSDER